MTKPSSFINDAPLPKPGRIRHHVNRVIDNIAFGIIKHCLSRSHHQQFDFEELDRFANQWTNATIDEFFSVTDFPESETNAQLLKKTVFDLCPHHTLSPTSGRAELFLDSPLRSGYTNNDRYWLDFHLSRPIDQAPLFIILHGWRSVSVKGYYNVCRQLNAIGVNAILTHLPYHFSRRPQNSFNGELAISADLVRSANGLRHGVMEMRWLTQQFKKMGVPSVGLWGTSYGGWIGALTVVVEPQLDALLMLEPPVEIERIFWEIPIFDKLTRHLNNNGVAREPIRHLFDLVTPCKHQPHIDPKKIVILGSLYDSIATPESLQRFHKAWPGTYLEIFPFAHISYRLHLAAMKLFKEKLWPQLKRNE